MVRDAVVGVLDCQSDNLDHFDKETIDLLTLFSTQASMACKTQGYTVGAKRATHSKRSLDCQACYSVLELDKLVRSVCTLVQGCFPGEHACVLLRDEDALVLRAQHGSAHAATQGGEIFPCGADWWNHALDSGGIENHRRPFPTTKARPALRRGAVPNFHPMISTVSRWVCWCSQLRAELFRSHENPSL